jgi:hypothetical protein
MIHLLREKAAAEQVADMLTELQLDIKLAVDVDLGILAGGGELHADGEEVLLAEGSHSPNIWGADWYPAQQLVKFEALINLWPRQKNSSMEILDPQRFEPELKLLCERYWPVCHETTSPSP